MAGFILWALLGAAFVGLGIYDMTSKKEKPFGFWANAKTFPVKDVRAYNRALGKLWCVFGIVFIILGIPLLLKGQNSPLILLSTVGVMVEVIAAMVIYVVVIEPKYRKK